LNVDMRAAFSRLGQRTVLVWGKQDLTNPVSNANALLGLNSQAELMVFDFCRAMPEQEHPEKFNELVSKVFGR
jgi:pimeloyl-ACP methyl ester carboxylesterase